MKPLYLIIYFLFPMLIGINITKTKNAPKSIPVILDTDIGGDIDDAYALIFALNSSELEILGVTTVTAPTFERAKLARKLLDMAGRGDIPVYAGEPGPKKNLKAPPQLSWSEKYQSENKLQSGAVEFIIKTIENNPGKITIIPYGPLSNIAKVLSTKPDIAKKIKEIVLMGGSLYIGYNERKQPKAEYNIRQDARASQIVFDSGIPIYMMGLDVTTMVKLTDQWMKKIKTANTTITNALIKLTSLWGGKIPTMYDPVAVTYSFNQSFVKVKKLHIQVDDKGFTKIKDNKPLNIYAGISIDKEKFLDFFVKRIIK